MEMQRLHEAARTRGLWVALGASEAVFGEQGREYRVLEEVRVERPDRTVLLRARIVGGEIGAAAAVLLAEAEGL